jgi:hypothetical protein
VPATETPFTLALVIGEIYAISLEEFRGVVYRSSGFLAFSIEEQNAVH